MKSIMLEIPPEGLPIPRASFCLYADSGHATLEQLIAHQREEQDLWAHAEDSGSESCYCEVARWNESRKRWERYAHCKMLDVTIDGLNDEQRAAYCADRINLAIVWQGRYPIVHRMPNWSQTK